jgi:toxin YoeB
MSAQRAAVCHPEVLDDLQHWIDTDLRTAKRLLELVRPVLRDPFQGIGKPEPLKVLGPGVWSGRNTQEHRCVVLVKADRVELLQGATTTEPYPLRPSNLRFATTSTPPPAPDVGPTPPRWPGLDPLGTTQAFGGHANGRIAPPLRDPDHERGVSASRSKTQRLRHVNKRQAELRFRMRALLLSAASSSSSPPEINCN